MALCPECNAELYEGETHATMLDCYDAARIALTAELNALFTGLDGLGPIGEHKSRTGHTWPEFAALEDRVNNILKNMIAERSKATNQLVSQETPQQTVPPQSQESSFGKIEPNGPNGNRVQNSSEASNSLGLDKNN